MCGALLWGASWWIFPLVGLLMCLGFLITAFRFRSLRLGCMCMGAHRGKRNQEVAETRE